MRNSAVKRIIAVLLCLVVFAGSELTGLTNIVGDLFASEMEVADEEGNEPDSQVDEIEIEAPAGNVWGTGRTGDARGICRAGGTCSGGRDS